jgi:Vitamin K-dependent gamma-carboxylase
VRLVSAWHTVASAWRSYWFAPVPLERLGIFRLLLCAYVTYDLLIESAWVTAYGWVDRIFYQPIGVIRAFHLPRLDAQGLAVLRVVLIVLAVLALVGLASRVALLLLGSLYVYWWGLFLSFNHIQHQKVAVALALFVLALAPSGRTYSVDAVLRRRRAWSVPAEQDEELAGWAVQMLGVLLCCLYGFAAYAKLKVTGIDWWLSGELEAVIGGYGSPLARQLALEHLWVVHALALFVLAFEASAPVLLFRTRFRSWYVCCAASFHLGCLLFLGINFIGWIVVCTALLKLERIPAALRRLAGSLRRAEDFRWAGHVSP